LVASIAVTALVACDGVPANSGLGAEVIVSGGQFMAGPMPGVSGGPRVVALDLGSNLVHSGEIEAPLSGALGPTATAAAVGIQGDRGYWIVPAGLPSVVAPSFPTFDVLLSFSASLAPGSYTLAVQAVDADDHAGPPFTETLTASAPKGPSGAMVVTLRWDSEADLDLHVEDPLGHVIWRGDITPAGSGATLDFDSNAGCVIDGRREENVIWADPPAPGRYRVLVDTFSLCAETFANWTVQATLQGRTVGRAEGESLVTDAEVSHDSGGAGVLALEIDVP
jgi:hypothetical protein